MSSIQRLDRTPNKFENQQMNRPVAQQASNIGQSVSVMDQENLEFWMGGAQQQVAASMLRQRHVEEEKMESSIVLQTENQVIINPQIYGNLAL